MVLSHFKGIDDSIRQCGQLTGKDSTLSESAKNYFLSQIQDNKAMKEELKELLKRIEVKDG